ncbi:hypothetical protein O181_116886, partial [Austropuccinia psidii MF-1]|nr:hypothetical protein [Austropuccinia psidii MF-1]
MRFFSPPRGSESSQLKVPIWYGIFCQPFVFISCLVLEPDQVLSLVLAIKSDFPGLDGFPHWPMGVFSFHYLWWGGDFFLEGNLSSPVWKYGLTKLTGKTWCFLENSSVLCVICPTSAYCIPLPQICIWQLYDKPFTTYHGNLWLWGGWSEDFSSSDPQAIGGSTLSP